MSWNGTLLGGNNSPQSPVPSDGVEVPCLPQFDRLQWLQDAGYELGVFIPQPRVDEEPCLLETVA